MSYKVRLAMFEGPFDLLVYLIENAQMSIYDIQISEITGQYLEYIRSMQKHNINISTEFMVLAAELVEIKSKMMLPGVEKENEAMELEDPRNQLASRLLAYKECKKQSEMLAVRQDIMMGIFEKPQEDISMYLENPDEYLSLEIGAFAKAFNAFLQRKQRLEETRRHYSDIERDKVTTEDRMNFIRKRFTKAFGSGMEELNFNELVTKKDRYDAAISFVSVLQMMREGYLDASQHDNYGEILVHKGVRSFEDELRSGSDGK